MTPYRIKKAKAKIESNLNILNDHRDMTDQRMKWIKEGVKMAVRVFVNENKKQKI